MSQNFNVGFVSIHALVNTDNLAMTVQELQERVASHPTIVDTHVSLTKANAKLTHAVEENRYVPGSIGNYYTFTTMLPNGEEQYTQVNEG